MTKAATNTKPSKNIMAVYEGRPFLVEEQQHHEDDYQEQEASGCGCGCFRVFGSKWWKVNDQEEEGTHLIEEKGEGRGEKAWGMLMEKLKKVKEASEVIAGPKWKTFIRKLSGYGKKQKNINSRFQYDEHSYALNFNSGAQSEDEDNMRPSFSAKFTAPGRRQNEL